SPPTPTVTATGGADLNTNGIRAFVLGCRTNAPPACRVDDLRIGTTWALVTGGLAIGSQPASVTQNAGTAATFSVTASGNAPLGYQWQNTNGILPEGAKYSGTQTATLTVSNLVAADNGGY